MERIFLVVPESLSFKRKPKKKNPNKQKKKKFKNKKNQKKKKKKKKRKEKRSIKLNIGKEIHWDWFAGLVPKRTSQIQKEPFAAGEWGC